jgi:hypothetical protein
MDNFILAENDYKKNIIKNLKLETQERNEKIYKKDKKYEKEMVVYKEKTSDRQKQFQRFQNDLFHIRENGDIKLNKWIITQKDPIIIFLSEFIQGTKVSKEIEKFRPIIKTTPTISVDEYRKKKKIGTVGLEYLKRLKDKYGIIVLKVLWANLNF